MFFLLALLGFIVLAPVILNTVSLFTVQKKLADKMIAARVIKAEDVKMIHPKKAAAGVVFSALFLVASVSVAAKHAPMGFVSLGVAFLAGLWKYRKVCQYNSMTVERFKNSYKDYMDINKYNKFVKENF